MKRLLGAAVAAAALLAIGSVPVAARAARPAEDCVGLIFACPSPTPLPVATPPPPQPFTLPPVVAPTLPPAATQPPAPPTAATATPTPSATVGAVPILVTPTPSPTPVTVGNDRNVAIPAIQPSSTGASLDGGGLLLRLFVVLALLAGGSVASMFALR